MNRNGEGGRSRDRVYNILLLEANRTMKRFESRNASLSHYLVSWHEMKCVWYLYASYLNGVPVLHLGSVLLPYLPSALVSLS